MNKKYIYIIIYLFLMAFQGKVLSQSIDNSLYFWKLHDIGGEVRLNGFYREQERIGLNINDFQKSSFLSGGIIIKTNSSFISKNFLLLDIDAAFMPETSRDNFMVTPDQAEVRTYKKIGGGATFFREKKISLNVFGDYNECFSSRENLTDVKSTNKHWGAALNYSNKLLPISIDFHNRNWEEKEIQSNRKNTFNQSVFGARINKSFTKRDLNEFRYSHEENLNLNQNYYRIANISDNIDFINHVDFDRKQKYSINSMLTNFNQQGIVNVKRFQLNESLLLNLPKNFSFMGNYNFFDTHLSVNDFKQHSVNTILEHKLFKSLKSRINFDYNTINHTVYEQSSTKYGAEINYSKNIPTGQFIFSYRYDRYHQSYNSDPVNLMVRDEQYNLADSKIVLLKLAYIDISTVVVKDATGTIIYQIGLDYILIQRGNYIEIRRIPGGLIADNASVLIDYSASQPGKYSYDANIHFLSSSIYLFHNILSFSYRFSTQDYLNLKQTEFITLNYFTQNNIGCRIDFNFINAGAEYEDYKSSILPYHRMQYFINFQTQLGKKIVFALNANMQNYTMLDQPEPVKQQYIDANAKVVYSIIRNTKLNVDVMYRNQSGRGIELDLLTAKAELETNFHRLFLSIGAELYRRNYVGEQINFKGAYFKLARKF